MNIALIVHITQSLPSKV